MILGKAVNHSAHGVHGEESSFRLSSRLAQRVIAQSGISFIFFTVPAMLERRFEGC